MEKFYLSGNALLMIAHVYHVVYDSYTCLLLMLDVFDAVFIDVRQGYFCQEQMVDYLVLGSQADRNRLVLGFTYTKLRYLQYTECLQI